MSFDLAQTGLGGGIGQSDEKERGKKSGKTCEA